MNDLPWFLREWDLVEVNPALPRGVDKRQDTRLLAEVDWYRPKTADNP